MKRQLQTGRFAQLLVLAVSLLFMAGCGGGGGGDSADSPGDESRQVASSRTASFEFVTDTYGLDAPTLLYAENNELGLVLRAETAQSESDMWFDTNVLRIDCPRNLVAGEYALGEEDPVCSITIFNGYQSTCFETVAGSLTVETAGEWFTGDFEMMYVDRSEPEETLYWSSASFSARVGFAEPIIVQEGSLAAN